MGRPKGAKNGSGVGLPAIRKWTPLHDMVVHFHIGTKSNDEIAKLVDRSPARVGQILADPRAKEMISKIQEEIKQKLRETVGDELLAISVKAVKNLRETIDIEGLIHGSDFKKHQDRLSFDVLKGLGYLKGDGERGAGDDMPLSRTLSERLVAAIEKANEVAALHEERDQKEIEVREAREVEFALVED